MGTLPAFILISAIAIVGSVTVMAGSADMTVRSAVFGSYLGSHIAFIDGVAASAYAGRAKKLGNGVDTLSCLNGLADPATSLVDDMFGVIGSPIHYLVGTVLHLNTDLPGFTVTLPAVIAHLVFGSGGLTGKVVPGESRECFTGDRGMLYNVVLGLGLKTITGFVHRVLLDGGASAIVVGSHPVPCFGIAAALLIFTQTEFAMSAAHHATLISALATASSQNPVIGIVLGILTALSGDFVGKTFSSCCDTHIDPPAFTISIFTFIVDIVFGSGLFSV